MGKTTFFQWCFFVVLLLKLWFGLTEKATAIYLSSLNICCLIFVALAVYFPLKDHLFNIDKLCSIQAKHFNIAKTHLFCISWGVVFS